jgi:hypothetical protein
VWVELAFQVTEQCAFLWQAVAVNAVSIVLDVLVIAMYFPDTWCEYHSNCFVTVYFVLL